MEKLRELVSRIVDGTLCISVYTDDFLLLSIDIVEIESYWILDHGISLSLDNDDIFNIPIPDDEIMYIEDEDSTSAVFEYENGLKYIIQIF